MPIYHLLENSEFDREHIVVMTLAFEDICRELGLAERRDGIRDIVAQAIINCAGKGERDVIRLKQCAHAALKA